MLYGFIGTGAITEAIVVGLSEQVSEAPPVALSPRNAGVAADLAARFPNVTVCSSNADVVDAADVVVLAVRPQDAVAALSALPFRPTQTVISVMAGLSIDAVSRLVAPATRVVRAIPLPEVARRSGMVPVHPFDGDAKALFERVGQVVFPPTEAALDAHSAVTAVVAGHLDYLDSVSGWLADQGVPPAEARRYVATIFRELSAGLDGEIPFAEMADRYATAGGINEQMRLLTSAEVRGIMRQALSQVLTRIST